MRLFRKTFKVVKLVVAGIILFVVAILVEPMRHPAAH